MLLIVKGNENIFANKAYTTDLEAANSLISDLVASEHFPFKVISPFGSRTDLVLFLFSLLACSCDLNFLALATSSCIIASGDIGCNTIFLSWYRKEY
jgi:hypothetical protein